MEEKYVIINDEDSVFHLSFGRILAIDNSEPNLPPLYKISLDGKEEVWCEELELIFIEQDEYEMMLQDEQQISQKDDPIEFVINNSPPKKKRELRRRPTMFDYYIMGLCSDPIPFYSYLYELRCELERALERQDYVKSKKIGGTYNYYIKNLSKKDLKKYTEYKTKYDNIRKSIFEYKI